MRAFILAALSASAAAAFAQDRPTVLQLPAGPRALGVGDAFVAGRTPEVLFYNPAQMAVQPGVAISGQRYNEFAGGGSVAGVFPLPGGAIGLGVQFLEFRDAPINAGAPGGTSFTGGGVIASSLVASLALTLPAIKTIRSGVTAKMAHEQVGLDRDEVIAADIGLAKDFLANRLTIAASAQNLGPSLSMAGVESELPARFTLGASAFAPPMFTYIDVAGAASLSYLRDGAIAPAGGIEITYVPLDGWGFTARAGFRDVPDRSDSGPLTLGAGVALDRVSFDYAFHSIGGGGTSHRIGLRVR